MSPCDLFRLLDSERLLSTDPQSYLLRRSGQGFGERDLK